MFCCVFYFNACFDFIIAVRCYGDGFMNPHSPEMNDLRFQSNEEKKQHTFENAAIRFKC